MTQFHPNFIGLTGSKEAIAAIAKKYRVFYRKAEEEGSTQYLMDHSNFIYFMSPEGRFLTMFRGGADPRVIAKTVTKYIKGT